MTFEGFDAALSLETSGFTPDPRLLLLADAPEAGTLDAALLEAARAERAEACAPDLWVEAGGRATSFTGAARSPLIFSGDHIPVAKELPLHAALGDEDEGQEVIVNGHRPRGIDNHDDGTVGGEYGDGGYPGGTPGGGGGGDGPSQETADAKDTPCVDEVPAGVDKDHLNDLAKAAASNLATLQDSHGWEYGAVIYRAANGQLYVSAPFTAQHFGDLNGAVVRVPGGSVIVGYVHTHPIDADVDNRTLSAEDRQFINGLIAMTGSVRADPNMLAYVTTKDGSADRYYDNYSTFVYDKSNRDATNPGCDL